MSLIKKSLNDGTVKWEVRLYENGRGSKRITRRFDRKSDAEDFLNKSKSDIKERKLNPFKQITFTNRTFADEANYWLEDGRLRFSSSHIKNIESYFKDILPKFGKLTVDRFIPEFLSQFQQNEKKKGSSNTTVNRKTDAIMAILNHSVKHRRIPFNPANGFRKLSKQHIEMYFWDSKEAQSFLTCMNECYPKGHPSRWVYVAYLVALNTAMRAGELWGLQSIDLSENGETIMVRRQYNRVTNTFGMTKGKKSRLVPCPEVLNRELKDLIELNNRKLNKENGKTIFQNEKGNPICHDNFFDRQFLKDLKKWGGRPVRFHDLRHTAATLMIANGIDLKTVKEICGHADIATTMNYVHMIAGSVNKVAKTFSVVPENLTNVIPLKLVNE